MKKIIRNNLIGIIIGIIISGTVGVVAATTISSKNVIYQNKTVNNALDELYNEATTGKELVAAAITNKGVTTTSNDTYETMATNINSIDTDQTEINQKLSNLESKHNSDIASLSGSISNLNQSLANKNKFTSTNKLAVNQDIVMNYDAFIMFRITYGNAAYTGYTFTINDVVRDAGATIVAVGEMTVTRSFEVKKGDKIRLDINSGTTCHESIFYFK